MKPRPGTPLVTSSLVRVEVVEEVVVVEVVSDHVVGVVGERPHAVLRAGVHVRQDSPDLLTNLSPLPTCTNFTHCQLEFVEK